MKNFTKLCFFGWDLDSFRLKQIFSRGRDAAHDLGNLSLTRAYPAALLNICIALL